MEEEIIKNTENIQEAVVDTISKIGDITTALPQISTPPLRAKASFWTKIGEKGKIATIMGIFLSFPINLRTVILFFMDKPLTSEYLTFLIIFNVLAMIWFILPSEISISSDKFNFMIKD